MTRLGTATTVLAILAVVVAAVLTLVPPDAAATVERELAPIAESTPRLLALGMLVAIGALLAATRTLGRTRRSVQPLRERPKPPVRSPRPGTAFETRLAETIDPSVSRRRRLERRDRLEAELRALAVEAVSTGADCPEAAARKIVETGRWSDDPRATAVLGGPEAPRLSWHRWLLDLLRMENAYLRRVRHAVEEIEALSRTDGVEVDTRSWDDVEALEGVFEGGEDGIASSFRRDADAGEYRPRRVESGVDSPSQIDGVDPESVSDDGVEGVNDR